MVQPLKLLAAAALAAAPVPALAQAGVATLSSAAVQAAEPAKEAPKPLPVALKDASALHHAVFHPQARPSLPKVQRTGDAEAPVPEIEAPRKESWTDKQGFRIAGAKLKFSQIF